jgi:hypothetical protein
MLIVTVSIPAAGRQALRRFANQNPRVPPGDGFSKLRREVGTTIHDPSHGFGPWGRREESRAQGRVRARTPENVFDGQLGRGEFNFI